MKIFINVFFLCLSFFAKSQTIVTICGNGTNTDSGDGGPATAATITSNAYGIFDIFDNFYFTEGPGNRVSKISPDGIIFRYTGTGSLGYSGDGGSATAAQLNGPKQIATDKAGNIYIADINNSRIRKVDYITGIISTVVGTGTPGYLGDGGPASAALLGSPDAISIDSFGNMYIGDQEYNVIRKVDALGNISTVAGTPATLGTTGDGGPATAALLENILALCNDKYGNLYISCGNVRKIDVSTGIINTIAGNGTYGYTGEGVLADTAEIGIPFDMCFDAYGALYLAETMSNRVRKIDTFGYMYTVAGNGIASYSGDGGPATNAEIYWPEGVAFDACGNLYINDLGNSRIRKVLFNPGCDIPLIANRFASIAQIAVYPSPTYDQLTITSAGAIHEVIIDNLIGQQLFDQVYNAEKAEVNVSGLPPGVYVVRVTDGDGNVVIKKILKE